MAVANADDAKSRGIWNFPFGSIVSDSEARLGISYLTEHRVIAAGIAKLVVFYAVAYSTWFQTIHGYLTLIKTRH